jgi:very-short-patch-repair endonuclease
MSRPISGIDGVFLGSHAISSGSLTARQLRDRGYRKVLHGVYALPEVPVDHGLYCRGASLVLPDGAVIGGRSAAFFQGAPWAGPGDPVTVLVPPAYKWTGRRGLRIHRTELLPGDTRILLDMPMTAPQRTAWDVAALESVADAVAALDAMVRAGSLTTSSLQAMVRNGMGRWRISRVRRAVELVDPRAESPAESWLRVAMVHAGLTGFVPQLDVCSGGRFLARVDFGWPELRIAVEYEGAHHFDGVQIGRDDRRLQALHGAGWLVIRVSAADLRDLPALMERIRSTLAARLSAR